MSTANRTYHGHQNQKKTSHGGERKGPEGWAKIWFAKLAKFHSFKNKECWEFTAEQVIAFLRWKVKAGTPVWRRLIVNENFARIEKPVGQHYMNCKSARCRVA